MEIVALTNQKGGSGKTTTAVNLAAALGEKGLYVLLIDLDPQASASHWYGVKDAGHGLLDVFIKNEYLADIIHNTNIKGVDIIPSSSWMVGIEKALVGEVGEETILQKKIRDLNADKWNYVFLDCPPALGILTINALSAAQSVLVPVETHIMALSGLVQLLKTVDTVKERLNSEVVISGILPCRVDTRTRHSKEIVENLRNRFGNLVFSTVIRENVSLAEAPSFGLPITQYSPKSAGTEDYRSLAEEIVRRRKGRS